MSCGLNPALKELGAPHSELIITLCRGWYQKSYPIGAGLVSQRPLTSNVFPSRRTKPPGGQKKRRQSLEDEKSDPLHSTPLMFQPTTSCKIARSVSHGHITLTCQLMNQLASSIPLSPSTWCIRFQVSHSAAAILSNSSSTKNFNRWNSTDKYSIPSCSYSLFPMALIMISPLPRQCAVWRNVSPVLSMTSSGSTIYELHESKRMIGLQIAVDGGENGYNEIEPDSASLFYLLWILCSLTIIGT